MDKKKLAWIAAGGLLLYFILKPKTAKASTLEERADRAFDELEGKSAQDSGTPGSGTPLTDEQVNSAIADNLPPTGAEDSETSSGSTPAQGRYVVQRGEGWSQIAKKLYGNYRLWPWLWDINRTPTRYKTLADGLQPGDTLTAPPSPPIDSAYISRIFARANAYTEWYRNPRTSSGRPRPVPSIVSEQTPLPTGSGPLV